MNNTNISMPIYHNVISLYFCENNVIYLFIYITLPLHSYYIAIQLFFTRKQQPIYFSMFSILKIDRFFQFLS